MNSHNNKHSNQGGVFDVVVLGFGGAGGIAAIEAYDAGNSSVVVLEKQPKDKHYPNTRMAGGGFHSPYPTADKRELKKYAKAMFSGEGLSMTLEEKHNFSDELAELWADYSIDNEYFMKSLDPKFITIYQDSAAFINFPGAKKSKYRVLQSSYTGKYQKDKPTKDLPKDKKESGEAFFSCISHGINTRNIDVYYNTTAQSFIQKNGEITGVVAESKGEKVVYKARKGVVLATGGYEYNLNMRSAFLEGPGVNGWAFHSSESNTGDGIEMALGVGAGLSKVSKIAGGLTAALPITNNSLKKGVSITAMGKPHEIIVDNYGRRYFSERKVTKNPIKYGIYQKILAFDTENLIYPRLPSWMIFDSKLMDSGSLIKKSFLQYHESISWKNNTDAVEQGWILKGDTIRELSDKIQKHPENRKLMNYKNLNLSIANFNRSCAIGYDLEHKREKETLGSIESPPYYALPLYAGGPNTKGGVMANAKRQVLNWDDIPIPRLYTAGEISSVFKHAYQAGGNLAECIVFGRIAGRNVAKEQRLS